MDILLWGGKNHLTVMSVPDLKVGDIIKVPFKAEYSYRLDAFDFKSVHIYDLMPPKDSYRVMEFWCPGAWTDTGMVRVGIHVDAWEQDFADMLNLMINIRNVILAFMSMWRPKPVEPEYIFDRFQAELDREEEYWRDRARREEKLAAYVWNDFMGRF